MLGLLNLWIFYVGGYVIAYLLRIWAENKRGEPFEDPELASKKKILIPALLWMLAGLIISLFVPLNTGILLYMGLIVTIIGLVIVGLAFYSFAQTPGLTTIKLHKYTRNPNYIGWIIFMGGLTITGWSTDIWSLLFLGYFIITIGYLHWTITEEEKFLLEKYGESYQEYLKNTPRYLGF